MARELTYICDRCGEPFAPLVRHLEFTMPRSDIKVRLIPVGGDLCPSCMRVIVVRGDEYRPPAIQWSSASPHDGDDWWAEPTP